MKRPSPAFEPTASKGDSWDRDEYPGEGQTGYPTTVKCGRVIVEW
jgi:hypothetical protein